MHIQVKDFGEQETGSFWQIICLVTLPLFGGFQGNVFSRSSPHVNLVDCGSRTTATTKMELFNKVTLCLGILERKVIVLVAEAKVLYRA